MGQFFSKKKNPVDKSIERFVTELLKHDLLNIDIVPDTMEQEVYEQLLEVVVKNITKVLNSSKITLLNQEIRIVVTPKESVKD